MLLHNVPFQVIEQHSWSWEQSFILCYISISDQCAHCYIIVALNHRFLMHQNSKDQENTGILEFYCSIHHQSIYSGSNMGNLLKITGTTFFKALMYPLSHSRKIKLKILKVARSEISETLYKLLCCEFRCHAW